MKGEVECDGGDTAHDPLSRPAVQVHQALGQLFRGGDRAGLGRVHQARADEGSVGRGGSAGRAPGQRRQELHMGG